jgi:hypothetical protein
MSAPPPPPALVRPPLPPGQFTGLTMEQLGIPLGRSAARDGTGLTGDQFKVVMAYQLVTKAGAQPTRKTQAEMAVIAGLTGDELTRLRKMQRILNGYDPRTWDPATKAYTGTRKHLPGAFENGWLSCTSPHQPRGLEVNVTMKVLDYRRFMAGAYDRPAAAEAPPETLPAIRWTDEEFEAEAARRAVLNLVEGVAAKTAAQAPAQAVAPTTAAVPSPVPAPDPEPPAADAPTAEELDADALEVLGSHHATDPRPQRAARLIHVLEVFDGVTLNLATDGRIVAQQRPGNSPLSRSRENLIRNLKPEITPLLTAQAADPPAATDALPITVGKAPGAPSAKGKPAPAVADAASLIAPCGRLQAAPTPDDEDCHALALAIVNDPGFAANDADPEKSYATFLGYARQVKAGALPQAVLIDALESAAAPGIHNRGAALVAVVARYYANRRAKP